MKTYAQAVLYLLTLLMLPRCFAGEMLDRVLLIVNSRVILQSDLENEIRLQKFMSATPRAPVLQADRDAALERLIDRTLMEQEMKGLDLVQEDDPQITDRLAAVRKQLTGAATDEGWNKLLTQAGLTEDDVRERVTDEMNTSLFLDAKFRPNLHVNKARIQAYYREAFVPEIKKRGSDAPPLEQVSDQIERILTEQTLNELFAEWMKGLRSQARVRIMDTSLKVQGFDSPSSLAGMTFPPLRISEEQGAAPAASIPAPARAAPAPPQR